MKTGLIASIVCVGAVVLVGCGSAPTTPQEQQALSLQVDETVNAFKREDGGITRFFNDSYGYVVFPEVAKGGAGVGGAHGVGSIFEQGRHVGYAELSQGTLGFQLGGQVYSEVIFFRNEAALSSFKAGDVEFAAQASAIAAKAGASADADYTRGVAVFTLGKSGLMAEAAIGGQKFTIRPK